MKRLLQSLTAFLALCSVCGQALAGIAYAITDLGTLGGTFSQAFAINNSGQVVGQAGTPEDHYRAFLYTGSGPMRDLGTLPTLPGNPAYYGMSINAEGQVAGYSYDFVTRERRALVWSGTGAVQDLGTLGGVGSEAVNINDTGQIVGNATTAASDYHAFLCTPGGPMTDLGTFGGRWSYASDINRYGQIVGTATTVGGEYHTFIYSGDGPMQDLGTLPGGRHSGASSINDIGQVVGTSDTASGHRRAFLYSGSGPMQELPQLGSIAVPVSINNLGQIVGYGDFTDGTAGAVFWPGDGRVLNLGALIDPSSGWTLIQANGINDRGQIVGYGTRADGYAHAFLLTPIPEPSTLSLLAIAGLGLVAFARRARSRKQ